MNRRLYFICPVIVLIVLILSLPSFGEEVKKAKRAPRERDLYMDLKILNRSESPASDPNKIVYGFELEVFNKTEKPINFSNVSFYLLDGMGGRYSVSSRRFASMSMIQPGQSLKIERIYFLVPKKAQLTQLIIFKQGSVVAKTSL